MFVLKAFVVCCFGGSSGIRTLGTLAGSLVFKTRAIVHSAKLPCIIGYSSQLSDLAAPITTMTLQYHFGAE
jgi:hypothetical protein